MIGFACGIKSEVQNAYLKIRAKFFRSDFVIEVARFRKSNCARRSLFLEVSRILLFTSFIALFLFAGWAHREALAQYSA